MRSIINNITMIGLLSVMLGSCITTSKVSIQVLEPARFSVPGSIQKVSLADNSNLLRGAYYLQIRQGDEIKKKVKFDSLISKAFMAGLSDVLYNSPRFIFNEKYSYKRSKTYKGRLDLLGWDEVKKICDTDTSDALIALEFFTMNDSSSKNVTYQSQTGGYYGSIKLTSVASWRIYYPYSDNDYTNFTVRDTMKWEDFSYSSADIALSLPDREWALEQAAYKAGRKFGEVIAQQWKTADRFIYDAGNMELRYAADQVALKDWKGALETWKEAYNQDHDSKKMKAALAYNIAVGNEVLDDIDEALNWAARSYQTRPSPEVSKYISQLEVRKKQKLKIQEQLGN